MSCLGFIEGKQMLQQSQQSTGFTNLYPHIARWVQSYGWIEIGADPYRYSLVRALDEGGLVWESRENDATLDDTLLALETFLVQRMQEDYA
jgi:hypothetical protein